MFSKLISKIEEQNPFKIFLSLTKQDLKNK